MEGSLLAVLVSVNAQLVQSNQSCIQNCGTWSGSPAPSIPCAFSKAHPEAHADWRALHNSRTHNLLRLAENGHGEVALHDPHHAELRIRGSA